MTADAFPRKPDSPFTEQTKRMWERRYSDIPSQEDARQIAENVAGFVRTLAQWEMSEERVVVIYQNRMAGSENDTQRLRKLRAYAMAKRMTVLHEFVDQNRVGDSGRPAFAAMLKSLKDGREGIVAVITETAGHLFKYVRDLVELDQECLGIELHFVDESPVILPSTPDDTDQSKNELEGYDDDQSWEWSDERCREFGCCGVLYA